MIQNGWRILFSCLLIAVFIAGITLQEPTIQQPPETTTTTTTILYHSIGTYQITAYSSVESCHNPSGDLCLMADGQPAELGAIACPRQYPFGTIFIIDDKEYICRDRLHINYDNRFDIWFGYGQENYIKAKEWGVKLLEVRIKES